MIALAPAGVAVGSDAVGMVHSAIAGRRAGEESVHVPNRADLLTTGAGA